MLDKVIKSKAISKIDCTMKTEREVMKYKDKEYVFTTDTITDIWVALNSQSALTDNKEITVRVKENKHPVNKIFPA